MRSYDVPFGVAVPYYYRDPAWLTPERLAELEARDRPEDDVFWPDPVKVAAGTAG